MLVSASTNRERHDSASPQFIPAVSQSFRGRAGGRRLRPTRPLPPSRAFRIPSDWTLSRRWATTEPCHSTPTSKVSPTSAPADAVSLPSLPKKAAYVLINNPAKRNALALGVLRDLKSQLEGYLTGSSGRLLTLPAFDPAILDKMEAGDEEYAWLLDGGAWRKERAHLPNVLVLRSEGPVFSSGHDLKELAGLSHDEVKETFALCADVMRLIRHSPAPVVCPIQGLATAAGFQLAMSSDYPITLASTPFRLPGATIGLPCTSPSTAISRRLGAGLAYRMLATADTITAGEVGSGAIDIVPVSQWEESTDVNGKAFEKRAADVIARLADETAGQPLALGKWAYWTQLGIRGSGGDGYEEAAAWAGRVMALHARAEDAKEGIAAFFGKRKPEWKT